MTDRRGKQKPRPRSGRGAIGRVRRKHSPARGPSRRDRGQVSWLAALYSSALPRSLMASSGISRLSLPLTVAGQRGHHTPFPFQSPRNHHEETAHDVKCQGTYSAAIYARQILLSTSRVTGVTGRSPSNRPSGPGRPAARTDSLAHNGHPCRSAHAAPRPSRSLRPPPWRQVHYTASPAR